MKDRKDVIMFDNKIIVIRLFRAIGWGVTKNENNWDRVMILLPNWDEELIISRRDTVFLFFFFLFLLNFVQNYLKKNKILKEKVVFYFSIIFIQNIFI